MIRRLAGLLAAWLLIGAPVAAAQEPGLEQEPRVAPPTVALSWSGRVLVSTTARAQPAAGARAVLRLEPTAPYGGGETRLLVTAVRRRGGTTWVRLLLPLRPNNSQGWVPADRLRLTSSPYRVVVDTARRDLTLLRSGRRVMRVSVAVGTPEHPTPRGRFAIAEVIRTDDPRGALGPIAMPITGFSTTLSEFDGGNGRVALHGTSLPELLGTRASHGCVRIRNGDIRALARHVHAGVPVVLR